MKLYRDNYVEIGKWIDELTMRAMRLTCKDMYKLYDKKWLNEKDKEYRFVIGYDESIEIFKNIIKEFESQPTLTTFKQDGIKSMIGENMNINDYYCDNDYEEELINSRHKLNVIEIDYDEEIDIKESIKQSINEGDYDISESLEIYDSSYITTDGNILIDGYFHDTSIECDSAAIEFHHDGKMWMDVDNDRSPMMLLSFDRYKKN